VKILAFILSIIVATALLMGALFLIIFTAPRHLGTGLGLVAGIAPAIFIYAPLTLGSLTTYWDVRNSPASRRYYARWLWVTVGLEVLAAIALVVFAVVAPAPIWVALLVIGVGIVLTIIAPVIGRALLRYDRKRRPDADADASWTPITRTEIAKKVRAVGITFLVAFIIAGVGFVVLDATTSKSGIDAGDDVVYTLNLALIAAGFACVVVTLPLNRRLRESVTRDVGLLRKVSKVVLRGKQVDLTADEQKAAAKYAVVMPVILTFTLAYIALLYLGLALVQVRQLVSGEDLSGSGPIFLGLYAVVLVVFFPLYIVRIRRARRYAHDHADLLPTGNPSQLLAETDR
jgi:hypothetical protein